MGPFPSIKSMTSDIIELIHFDLCGPKLVKSLGGYLYYIIFVDELSQKTWILYLNLKDKGLICSNISRN